MNHYMLVTAFYSK